MQILSISILVFVVIMAVLVSVSFYITKKYSGTRGVVVVSNKTSKQLLRESRRKTRQLAKQARINARLAAKKQKEEELNSVINRVDQKAEKISPTTTQKFTPKNQDQRIKEITEKLNSMLKR